MKKYNNLKNVFSIVLVIAVVFVAGFYVGFNKNLKTEQVVASLGKETGEITEAELESFWKVWDIINEKYPGAEKLSNQEKIFGAISGLVESLGDPYSVFMDQEETKSFKEEISGSFSGVGMEVGIKNNVLTVIAPLKDTPAYRAGIIAGDKILKIGEKDTTDMTIEEAIKLIRGKKGTEVTLFILHNQETKGIEIKITRDTIQIPTIDTEIRADGIFVIKLYSFSANSTKLFQNAIKAFVVSGKEKLLLDLRGNPGGYLDASVDMASWFLPKGKVVVIEDYGDEKKEKFYRSAGYNIFGDNLKMVILIDGGSASASEILAGALQDYDRAILVGEKTFGKGSVQEVVKITPDTILKLTVAKWLTPEGTSISETGLTADYSIEITKEDVTEKRDPQMDKAAEVLNNWYILNQ